MTQYARPASDITNSTWTTLPTGGQALYLQVNESAYSDTNYIRANGAQTCEVKLSSVTDPVSSLNHILRLRAKATGSSSAEKWTVSIYQGSTLIATAFSASNVTRTTFNDYVFTLTAAQADAITNYTDLRVRIVSSASTGEYIDVSWIVFEVPDVIQNQTYNETATVAKSDGLTVSGSLKITPPAVSVARADGMTVSEKVALNPAISVAKKDGLEVSSSLKATNGVAVGRADGVTVTSQLAGQESADLSVTMTASFQGNLVIDETLYGA